MEHWIQRRIADSDFNSHPLIVREVNGGKSSGPVLWPQRRPPCEWLVHVGIQHSYNTIYTLYIQILYTIVFSHQEYIENFRKNGLFIREHLTYQQSAVHSTDRFLCRYNFCVCCRVYYIQTIVFLMYFFCFWVSYPWALYVPFIISFYQYYFYFQLYRILYGSKGKKILAQGKTLLFSPVTIGSARREELGIVALFYSRLDLFRCVFHFLDSYFLYEGVVSETAASIGEMSLSQCLEKLLMKVKKVVLKIQMVFCTYCVYFQRVLTIWKSYVNVAEIMFWKKERTSEFLDKFHLYFLKFH